VEKEGYVHSRENYQKKEGDARLYKRTHGWEKCANIQDLCSRLTLRNPCMLDKNFSGGGFDHEL